MANFNLESGIAKLYELKTEIERSIENLETLEKQYDALHDLVESSDKKDSLPPPFLDGLSSYKQETITQRAKLSDRLSYIKTLIDKYEKKDHDGRLVDTIVTLAMASLGIIGEPQEAEEETEEAAEEATEEKTE